MRGATAWRAAAALCVLAAAAAAAQPNVRPTLVALPRVALGEVSVSVLVRSGDAPVGAASVACAGLQQQGASCAEEHLRGLEQGFGRVLEQPGKLSHGETAVARIGFGWELLFLHSQPGEARVQLLAARSAFPASQLAMRELAAMAMLLPLQVGGIFANGASRGGIVAGDGGQWAYVRPFVKDADFEYLEIWEAHAELRHQRPLSTPEADEGALLGAGAPPSALLPLRDPFDFAATSVDEASLRLPPRRPGIREHRLRHDLLQVQLLRERGLLDPATGLAAAAAYRELLVAAPRLQEGIVAMSEEHWRLLYPFYNRRLYIHPCPATQVAAVVAEGPVTTVRSGAAVEGPSPGGAMADGGVLVVDGLLSAEAMRALRDFAELSTVWFKEYDTYLGAMMWSGFSTPLLAQIAGELRAAFPEVLCDMALQYVWAFKYDDKTTQGVGTHADEAAISVNLWLTPDDENLDPESGGLLVHDATVLGTNLTAQDYNGAADGSAMARLLNDTGRANVTVPYRENRAVIFPSTRLHHTQPFVFRSGLRSRRIDVTFLFGQKGMFCPQRVQVAHVLRT